MEKEQNTYTVDLKSMGWGDENIAFVGGENPGEAIDNAISEYGLDSWIVAVDFYPNGWKGEFSLVEDSRGYIQGIYANKTDAIRHNDILGEHLIAVPHLSR